MLAIVARFYRYRELIAALAWRNIVVTYKQAYLGVAWAVVKPVFLLLTFIVVRLFVGIDAGDLPYAALTFAALLPWLFFQESVSQGVVSVVNNQHLIRKIYFPREIFPLTALAPKFIDLAIGFVILAGLMTYFRILPTWQLLWLPLLLVYMVLVALSVALIGSATNVYYRDIGAALPLMMSLLLYASPVIYPLSLVRQQLQTEQLLGAGSDAWFRIYTLNPMAGIIDAFQNVLLRGVPPDLGVLWPGMVLTAVLLPIAYLVFKRAERHFADII